MYLISFSLRNLLGTEESLQLYSIKTDRSSYEISYGTEEHLPYEAKKMMKTCYYGYNITSATEVSVEWDSKAWIINLANNENL